jgi:hypothetical protein
VAKRIVKGLRDESPSTAVLLVDGAYGLGEGEGDALDATGAPLSSAHALRRWSAPAAKRKRSEGSSVMP